MSKNGRRFIYSNKKHTERGIFSTILAAISFVSMILLMVLSYRLKGEAPNSYGAVAFLCTLFSGAGIPIGIWGKSQPDRYYVFSHIGIIWNIVDLFIISGILYAGL